jgi:hypothetical protein
MYEVNSPAVVAWRENGHVAPRPRAYRAQHRMAPWAVRTTVRLWLATRSAIRHGVAR